LGQGKEPPPQVGQSPWTYSSFAAHPLFLSLSWTKLIYSIILATKLRYISQRLGAIETSSWATRKAWLFILCSVVASFRVMDINLKFERHYIDLLYITKHWTMTKLGLSWYTWNLWPTYTSLWKWWYTTTAKKGEISWN
jgi:hypothetical protein